MAEPSDRVREGADSVRSAGRWENPETDPDTPRFFRTCILKIIGDVPCVPCPLSPL